MDACTVTLTAFAGEHSIGLTRFAYALTGDRQLAQDLVQDCLLALYRRFGEALPLGAPLAHARKTITDTYLSRLRRRSSGELITDIVPEQALPAADSADQDAVWRVLAALPHRQRAVLVLRYYVDLSDAEIAQTIGCREGTVRSLAARVYWAQSGRVVDHDITTRQPRTLVPGGARSLRSSSIGVAWTDAQNGTHPVAGSPLDQVPGTRGIHPGLVTDETAYAWLAGSSIPVQERWCSSTWSASPRGQWRVRIEFAAPGDRARRPAARAALLSR